MSRSPRRRMPSCRGRQTCPPRATSLARVPHKDRYSCFQSSATLGYPREDGGGSAERVERVKSGRGATRAEPPSPPERSAMASREAEREAIRHIRDRWRARSASPLCSAGCRRPTTSSAATDVVISALPSRRHVTCSTRPGRGSRRRSGSRRCGGAADFERVASSDIVCMSESGVYRASYPRFAVH